MKGWIMIHKIKALHDNGNGLSIRQIAQELRLSRNTVSKYVNMEESEIERRQSQRDRYKKLDGYRGYITHLLQIYPNLSAVKILRKLKAKVELYHINFRLT
ncbi:MAG: MarR family transcriptional regulator [Desulfamplus sp.]|nr:MarR family transcriptional regulator [Desulfamplus sp.]